MFSFNFFALSSAPWWPHFETHEQLPLKSQLNSLDSCTPTKLVHRAFYWAAPATDAFGSVRLPSEILTAAARGSGARLISCHSSPGTKADSRRSLRGSTPHTCLLQPRRLSCPCGWFVCFVCLSAGLLRGEEKKEKKKGMLIGILQNSVGRRRGEPRRNPLGLAVRPRRKVTFAFLNLKQPGKSALSF